MRLILLAALTALQPVWGQPRPFGEMVTLEGHRVHLHCEGQGSPVVLLLHGTPRFSFHFALVWPKVAAVTRVCVYDRAGDAWSDRVPGQPSADIFVAELDRVVRYISSGHAVVLAGHSVGGVLARAYFATHPERVAAMVLIDTMPVEVKPGAMRGSPPPAPPADLEWLRPPFDRLPARFQAAHRWATRKWFQYAAEVDLSQARRYQEQLYQLASQARSRTLPVWFLSRAAAAAGREPWVETQRKMTSVWGRGVLVRVAPSGHDIELEQPEAVAGAVAEAVRLARANAE